MNSNNTRNDFAGIPLVDLFIDLNEFHTFSDINSTRPPIEYKVPATKQQAKAKAASAGAMKYRMNMLKKISGARFDYFASRNISQMMWK